MIWEITQDKLNTLIEWYAMDIVLVEEYEDETKEEKRIALNVYGCEMEEQEYNERRGMIMAYEDWFRMIGVYPKCIQINRAIKKVIEENDHEVSD